MLVKNEVYPEEVGTLTSEIKSVVVFLYQVKSSIALLLKSSKSKPTSNSSVFSGLKLGLPSVDGTNTEGCPAYTVPTLKILLIWYGSASLLTLAQPPLILPKLIMSFFNPNASVNINDEETDGYKKLLSVLGSVEDQSFLAVAFKNK